jgi:DNA-binding beta-propeller fold protein YncE
VTGTINVGGSSAFVAFSPNGRSAYIGVDDPTFDSGKALIDIDVATEKIKWSVAIETGAQEIAVNPNGYDVYVASDVTSSSAGGTPSEIQVINVREKKVIATFGPRDSVACGLSVNPKGTRLYASFCEYNGAVSQGIPPMEVFNTDNNSVISKIEILGGSRGIVVSPNGKYVYTALDTTYGLGVISASTNSLIGSIPVPNGNPLGSLNLVNIDLSGKKIYAATWNLFSDSSFISFDFSSIK